MSQFCESCGAMITDNSKFCTNCGAPVQPLPQSTMYPYGAPDQSVPPQQPQNPYPPQNAAPVPPQQAYMPGYGNSGGTGMSPTPSKKPSKRPILIAVIALAVIAVGVVIYLLVSNRNKDTDSSVSFPTQQMQTSQQPAAFPSHEGTANGQTGQAPVQTGTQETATAQPSSSETQTGQTGTVFDESVIRYDDAASTAQAMTTYKRPDKADFDGYIDHFQYEDDMKESLARNNARYIMQPAALNGGWIGLLDYYNSDEDIIRYFNAELQISNDGTVAMIVDWYQSYDNDERTYTDETMLANTRFTGRWNSDGSIELSSPGVGDVHFRFFFETTDGYQHAFGSISTAEGDYAINPGFMLIRPGWVMEPYLSSDLMDGYKSTVQYSDLAPAGWTQTGATGTGAPQQAQQPSGGSFEPSPSGSDAEITDVSLDDFDDVMGFINGEFNGDPTLITDYSLLNGKWKSIILYAEEDGDDYYIFGRELLIGEMFVGDRAVTINMNALRIVYDGESDWTEEDFSYTYNGSLDDGEMIGYTEGSRIDLYYFFEVQGRQYCLGDLTLQSGETAYIAFVRP